ncbi:hypothetical protein [Achromobacter phage Motura]|uniref:Uncharacterized protein n=1 Tax=Achromobacter phage Motura TaxID=2591403 RepID=A0A514CT47_9CAUD|nr:hypothetical protein H1O15_gp145 [Achromobacter phage Motura]QDH83643.1 hypothetical protein [Achromobacter phage Motura]
MAKPKIYNIGVAWDEYTSGVEGNLARDLIALKTAAEKWPGTTLQVVSESDEADRMLRALGLQRSSIVTLPGTWILYQAGEQRVNLPEGVEYSVKKVERCLFQKSKKARLEDCDDQGFALKEQGRDNTFDPFNRMPSTSTDWHMTDPLITLIWSR